MRVLVLLTCICFMQNMWADDDDDEDDGHFPQQSVPRRTTLEFQRSRYHDVRTYNTPEPQPQQKYYLFEKPLPEVKEEGHEEGNQDQD